MLSFGHFSSLLGVEIPSRPHNICWFCLPSELWVCDTNISLLLLAPSGALYEPMHHNCPGKHTVFWFSLWQTSIYKCVNYSSLNKVWIFWYVWSMLLHKSFNEKALKGKNYNRLKKGDSRSDEKSYIFQQKWKWFEDSKLWWNRCWNVPMIDCHFHIWLSQVCGHIMVTKEWEKNTCLTKKKQSYCERWSSFSLSSSAAWVY